ncbi:hypothetical protein ACS0TY_010507 [Phlomoides rotata]
MQYLDENKNLIMAILECQKTGKVAECAQYQAILQKNLMYLAAIADAQPPPPDSSKPSQPPTNSVAPQGDSRIPQTQASPVQQLQPPQPGGPVPRMPFQLNALRPDQQNQLLHYQQQQQLQGHFALGGGANNGMHMLMHPGLGNPGGGLMDLRGSQSTGPLSGVMDASSGDGQGNSSLRRVEGRD